MHLKGRGKRREKTADGHYGGTAGEEEGGWLAVQFQHTTQWKISPIQTIGCPGASFIQTVLYLCTPAFVAHSVIANSSTVCFKDSIECHPKTL